MQVPECDAPFDAACPESAAMSQAAMSQARASVAWLIAPSSTTVFNVVGISGTRAEIACGSDQAPALIIFLQRQPL